MLFFKGCKPVMHSQQFFVNCPATFAAWEHRLKHLHEQVFPVKMFFFGVPLIPLAAFCSALSTCFLLYDCR